MKFYRDLNLAAIRDAVGIDFAHFTFGKGQCSCCYGPMDLPARYWKDGKKPENRDTKYTYLLFKNASNGSGTVTKNDAIDRVYVLYSMTPEQVNMACEMLQEQLGYGYVVEEPKDHTQCIYIYKDLLSK